MSEVRKIIDGDTIRARLDLGCDVRIDLTLRLYGLNAPERNTEEGQAATAWLAEQISHALSVQGGGEVLVVNTVKDRREKYGRYLAVLRLEPSGRVLNDEMIAAGHAVAKHYGGSH